MIDYTKAVSSLLYKFQQDDFLLRIVDNGEQCVSLIGKNNTDARKLAVQEVCSVDQSVVYLTPFLASEKAVIRLVIILGNEENEILADWSAPEHFHPRIKKFADEFYYQWESN